MSPFQQEKSKLTCHNCHGIPSQMDCGRFLAAWSIKDRKFKHLKTSYLIKSFEFSEIKLSYISILICGDRNKLRLRERERLHAPWLARVLGSVLVHLHHMQSRLVFMQRLQYDHLQEFKRKNECQRTSPHASLRTVVPFRTATLN